MHPSLRVIAPALALTIVAACFDFDATTAGGDLVDASVPADASTEFTVPAMFRNEPEITASAVTSPSGVRAPRARSWSPGLISLRELFLASLNLIESGA